MKEKATKERAMSANELEDMLAAIRLIEETDWEVLSALADREATAIEKLIASSKTKVDGRIGAGKRRAALNKKRRRAREWERKKIRSLLMDIPEHGWWAYLKHRQQKLWCISKEEWDEHVELRLDGEVILVRRYAQNKPYTLDNIYVVDEDSKAVLFDGAEHKLKDEGHIL